MSKKSIDHDEALRQAYAADPMQAVADVHELTRQANELEDRVRELELTVKFILHKYLSPEESTDCDLRGIPCPHRYGRWWCTADEDERVSCHVRAAIKAAKEAGE